MSSSDLWHGFVLAGGGAATLGAIALLVSLSRPWTTRLLKRAKDLPVAKLKAGELSVVRGRVVPLDGRTVTAPVTHAPVLYAEQLLTIVRRSGNTRHTTTQRNEQGFPFTIDDGSGAQVVVVPSKVTVELKPGFSAHWDGMLFMPSPAVLRWIVQQGQAGNELRSGRDFTLEERTVTAGETLTVLGIPSAGPDGRLVIQDRPDLYGRLHFFSASRGDLIRSVSRWRNLGFAGLLLGGVLAASGYLLMQSMEASNRRASAAAEVDALDALDEHLSHWKEIRADAAKRGDDATTPLKPRKKGNVRFFHLDAADEIGNRSFAPCVAMAKAKSGLSAGATVEECNDVDYVVVVFKRSLVEPRVDAKAKDFSTGSFDGVGHAYEVESGKYLGAAVVHVQTSKELSIPKRDDPVRALKENLMRNLEDQLLVALVPSAKP